MLAPVPAAHVLSQAFAGASTHKSSMAESVAAVVRHRIMAGHLPAGTKLTEEVVAEMLGVSRNTFREASIMLEGEGICERRAHRGVFVVEPTLAMVRDLYASRLVVEAGAVAWGIAWSPEAVGRIRARADDGLQARERGDWAAGVKADLDFHRALVALSGSALAIDDFETTMAQLRLVFNAIGDLTFHDPYLVRNDALAAMLMEGRRVEAAESLGEYLITAADEVAVLLGGAEARDA